MRFKILEINNFSAFSVVDFWQNQLKCKERKMKLKTFHGGIHIKDYKTITENNPIVSLPSPDKVYIPCNQHFGAPAKPVVKKDDIVKIGQIIAESQGGISANVHSSISGKVKAIENRPGPLGLRTTTIVIENDKQEIHVDETDIKEKTSLEKIGHAGIVGMGGAMFPANIKLQPPKDKQIDTLILNGAECEPYITADYRLMIEQTDQIVKGLEIIKEILNIENVYIGIESNKTKAINLLSKAVKNFKIVALKTKYPQGGEKQLIKAIVNREVPSGGLPFDIGVVVQNVATVFAVYEAVTINKPLYERIVTVAGSAVKNPGNYKVRIGSLFSDIVEIKGDPGKVIMGGPMMGFAQYTLDVPVIKGTNSILVMDKRDVKVQEQQPCIRCGKCILHCPMGLWPGRLGDLIEQGNIDEAKENGLKDCIECGICAYLCPSNRDIVQLIKYGKSI